MRLWILSHLRDSPGNRRVLEAALDAGHVAEVVDPTALNLEIHGAPTPRLVTRREDGACDLPELVFTRMGGSAPEHAFDALHQLESAGVTCLNNGAALALARDKVHSFQRLARAGVALPATVVVGAQASGLEQLIEPLGPPPWIVKLPRSTQGRGVTRVDSLVSLITLLDMLRHLGQRVLIQHYVREASGVDLRVLVVGGRAIAAMRRQAGGDEVRSNLHLGGTANSVEITPELERIALDSARALGLEIAGVDLLLSAQGPLVAEVNGSPGLEGLEKATGRDLAAILVSYLGERISSS